MLPYLEEVDLLVVVGRLDCRLLVAVVIVAVAFALELVAVVGLLEQLPFVVVVEASVAEGQFAALEASLPFGFVVLETGCNLIPRIYNVRVSIKLLPKCIINIT